MNIKNSKMKNDRKIGNIEPVVEYAPFYRLPTIST